MTDDEVVALGRKAHKIALNYCGKEDAEEIAGEVVEHILTKQPENYRLSFLVIDMLRKRVGREKHINVEAKRNVYKATDVNDDNLASVADTSPSVLEEIESREQYERARNYLEPIQRCVATLFVQYGLTFKEIADCFGYSDSWVSQIAKNMGHKLERVKILSRKRT